MQDELGWLLFKLGTVFATLSLLSLIAELTITPGAINPSIALGFCAVFCWLLFIYGLLFDRIRKR